jgi:pimeloyl-ACP methyl ester carboxylesterase
MRLSEFVGGYREVDLSCGRVAYVEHGAGPSVVFVHGVSVNSALWRGVIGEIASSFRCVAVDLPCHGRSPAWPDRDYSLRRLADLVVELIEALGLGAVHLVGNDTGGAVCQVLAGMHPEAVATLTLTNCDTVGNIPPPAFKQTVELARAGRMATVATRWVDNLDLARLSSNIGGGYCDPSRLSDEMIEHYLGPVMGTTERAVEFEFFLTTALRDEDLVSAEESLRSSTFPAAIVWGRDDIFFGTEWGDHLADVLPGAGEPILVDDARLYFADERPEVLVPHLRDLWGAS